MIPSSRRLVVLLALTAAVLVALPLIAYAAAGDLDTTFNGTGMQTTDLGAVDFAFSVVGLAGGKVLVAGASGGGIGLVRYTNAGGEDAGFGGGDGKVTASALSQDYMYNGLAVLSNGKILVAAEADTATNLSKMVLFRFTASGSPDSTFGGGTGKRIVGFGKSFSPYDLVVLPSGKILVTGEFYKTANNTEFLVTRLKPSGALDNGSRQLHQGVLRHTQGIKVGHNAGIIGSGKRGLASPTIQGAVDLRHAEARVGLELLEQSTVDRIE